MEWKDIPWTKGYYSVSDTGLIHSNTRKTTDGRTIKERILAPNRINSGYDKVYICVDGIKYSKLIHRLVAEAFCDNYSDEQDIDHLNGNKTDNRACNLECVTRSENIQRAYDNGLNHVSEKRLLAASINAARNIRTQGHPIAMCDLDGNIIETFDSCSQAKRKYHVHISCIKNAANNNTISYNYKCKWIKKCND